MTYRYLYDRNALRIITISGGHQEYIVKFKSRKHKSKAQSSISRLCTNLNPMYAGLESADLFSESQPAMQALQTFVNLWQHGQLSNAEYLLLLNFTANRSFNDPSQYPVFPWIVTDYKNETGATRAAIRDLKKAIGSLSDDKFEQFKSKYFEMVSKDPKSSPFLKGVQGVS